MTTWDIFWFFRVSVNNDWLSDHIFDWKIAFEAAIQYELDEDLVFPNKKLKEFLRLKGIQYAVHTKMFIGSFLATTSNAMGMAKVKYREKQMTFSFFL